MRLLLIEIESSWMLADIGFVQCIQESFEPTVIGILSKQDDNLHADFLPSIQQAFPQVKNYHPAIILIEYQTSLKNSVYTHPKIASHTDDLDVFVITNNLHYQAESKAVDWFGSEVSSHKGRPCQYAVDGIENHVNQVQFHHLFEHIKKPKLVLSLDIDETMLFTELSRSKNAILNYPLISFCADFYKKYHTRFDIEVIVVTSRLMDREKVVNSYLQAECVAKQFFSSAGIPADNFRKNTSGECEFIFFTNGSDLKERVFIDLYGKTPSFPIFHFDDRPMSFRHSSVYLIYINTLDTTKTLFSSLYGDAGLLRKWKENPLGITSEENRKKRPIIAPPMPIATPLLAATLNQRFFPIHQERQRLLRYSPELFTEDCCQCKPSCVTS